MGRQEWLLAAPTFTPSLFKTITCRTAFLHDTRISYITSDIGIESKLLYRRSGLHSCAKQNSDRQYRVP